MSTGRKRSGFQITSVTSDYGQAGKESFASDTGSPNLAPLTNGGHILPTRSPRGSPRSSPPASVSTHQVGSGDAPLLNSEPNVKEVDAGSADKIRTALPQSRDEGVVRPVTVDEKGLALPLDSGVTLVVPIIKTGDTPSSQQGPISSVTQGNEHAPNGTQTSSSSSQLPVNTSIGHAPLVNDISSQPEIKAGSSNGAIPKNGPLLSVVNGSLISPVITAGPAAAATSSRFRVVKLDQGLGEPYKKGRWTCVDFYDKDMDSHSISRILDSMRHGHSLDSHLEVAGLSNKPVTQFYPQLSGKGHGTSYVHSQGTAHLVLHNATLNVTNPQQARSLSGLPQISLELGQGVGLKSPLSARNSPTSELNPLLSLLRINDATQRSGKTTSPTDVHPSSAVKELTGFSASETSTSEDLGNREQHTSAIPSGVSSQGLQGFHVVPVVVVDEPTTSHPISKNTIPLIQAADRRKSPTRRSRSRSPSPAQPRFRDKSPSTNLSDPFNVHSARLSLARSMFSISGTSDSDDERRHRVRWGRSRSR